MPEDESGGDEGPATDEEAAPAEKPATAEEPAHEDPADRRVAPYSAETSADIDPTQPPDRAEDEEVEPDLRESIVEEAERLTRLARRVPDEAEAEAYRERRADLLAEHDYAARVREERGEPTLVCHPIEWLDEDDAIDPARIDEIDRAADVPLGAATDPDAWDAVADRNGRIVEQVRAAHGDVHAANAEAYATYVANHHAKPIPAVTADELELFFEEYYPRNVWPTEEERAALEESIELVYAELDVPVPTDRTVRE